MPIVRYTEEEMDNLPDTSDMERVLNMTDEDIDFSDIPELTDEMASKMVRYSYGKPVDNQNRININFKIDADTFTFFKNMGDDWQTRINEALFYVVKMKSI